MYEDIRMLDLLIKAGATIDEVVRSDAFSCVLVLEKIRSCEVSGKERC